MFEKLSPQQRFLAISGFVVGALLIVAAMFWVGMPFTMRNQITWVTASEKRWRGAAFAGIAYGALLVIGGLLVG